MTIFLTNIILPSGQSSNGIILNNGAIQFRANSTKANPKLVNEQLEVIESNYVDSLPEYFFEDSPNHESSSLKTSSKTLVGKFKTTEMPITIPSTQLSKEDFVEILDANKDIQESLFSHVEIRKWVSPSNPSIYPEKLNMNPTKRISNVSNSFVEINDYNEIMLKHGITKRNFTTLHKMDHENLPMNLYLNHMVEVLNRHKDNPEKYWKLCFALARRSNVFLALMLTEFDPAWHRNMSLKELHLLVYKLRTMWHSNPHELAYRRCYIPKEICPDTGLVRKYRPLGVPKVMWRTYLHTWNQFFMIFLSEKLPLSQHGFFSGRGTKTAWEELLSNVIHQKDIVEFDLKGFFPSVNVASVCNQLEE